MIRTIGTMLYTPKRKLSWIFPWSMCIALLHSFIDWGCKVKAIIAGLQDFRILMNWHFLSKNKKFSSKYFANNTINSIKLQVMYYGFLDLSHVICLLNNGDWRWPHHHFEKHWHCVIFAKRMEKMAHIVPNTYIYLFPLQF